MAIFAIVVVFQTISLIVIAVYLAKISRSFDQLTANVSAFLDVAKRSVERIEPRIHAISQTVQGQLQQVDSHDYRTSGQEQDTSHRL